jgi:hypothetical protein
MLTPFPSTSTLTLAALIPLICWRMYSRFKRLVGRQRFSHARPWISLGVFSLITVFLAIGTRAHPEVLWLLAGAAAIGLALGVFGLRKTQFEVAEDGLFYTPNAHLGIALSLLLFARIIYRAFEVAMMGPDFSNGMSNHAATPLTIAIFGLLAGYYVTYAVGLLRWHSTVSRKQESTQPESAQA